MNIEDRSSLVGEHIHFLFQNRCGFFVLSPSQIPRTFGLHNSSYFPILDAKDAKKSPRAEKAEKGGKGGKGKAEEAEEDEGPPPPLELEVCVCVFCVCLLSRKEV